ncbi:hypothetical protein JCM9533A_02840 [Catenuloplanes niger JCM 9533]
MPRYWLSAREMRDRFRGAGFAEVFEGSTPAEGTEPPYGCLLVRRTGQRARTAPPGQVSRTRRTPR